MTDTTIKIRKEFIPVLNSSQQYNIYFRNSLYNPITSYNSSHFGILTSNGFKIDGDATNVYYLDDDGAGNVRRYYVEGSTRVYALKNQGTINYNTGQITLNSLNVIEVENASTVIQLTVIPNSNDIVPVRNQVLQIDLSNSSITVEIDTYVAGSSQAGIGYITFPSR